VRKLGIFGLRFLVLGDQFDQAGAFGAVAGQGGGSGCGSYG
jgi:FAD/FMN-containing dehydrogenase